MLVTKFTRKVLAYRRGVKRLEEDGFREIALLRGCAYGEVFTDVKIGPDGTTIWVKVEKKSNAKAA